MMTDEEIIRKSCRDLEMIWGVDSSEIAKIIHSFIERDIGCGTLYDRFNSPPPPIYIGPVKVKSLKEKLEEATMHEDCYFCIKRDICTKDVPKPCKYRYTEEERIADQASDRCGAVLNGTYLHPTFRKKKEDNEMKATSTQTFKDIIAVDFELQTFPDPDVEDKFIVSATNRDDIFCFVFEGKNVVDACRRAGLLTGWEKDRRIRELEMEEILKRNSGRYPWDEEPAADNVNHPSHYTGRYECIDVMQDVFGNEATNNFCLCNAFKYIWRARKKNGLEDVKKAVWYLTRYIEEAENGVQKGEQV